MSFIQYLETPNMPIINESHFDWTSLSFKDKLKLVKKAGLDDRLALLPIGSIEQRDLDKLSTAGTMGEAVNNVKVIDDWKIDFDKHTVENTKTGHGDHFVVYDKELVQKTNEPVAYDYPEKIPQKIQNIIKKHYLKLMSEAIEPMSAVLVAHTKAPKDKDEMKYHVLAAGEIKKQGKNMTPESLEKILKAHKIGLKSAHPDAVKNLHKNLMKVKTEQSYIT